MLNELSVMALQDAHGVREENVRTSGGHITDSSQF